MKRIYFCVLLLVMILGLSLYSEYYILKQTAVISDILQKASSEAASDKDRLDYAREANRLWLNFSRKRAFILEKEHVTEITTELQKLLSKAEYGVFDETFPADCETARKLIGMFCGLQEISVYNIL